MRNRNQKSGFTIVELLIVIVVIGILAAITIVSFNGVQTRAKTTSTINAAGVYVKAIKLLIAEGNTDASFNGTSFAANCLGPIENYPAGTCTGMGVNASVKSAFNTLLQPYAGNNTAIGAFTSTSVYPTGAIIYTNGWFGANSAVIYALPPNTPCGLPNVMSDFGSGIPKTIGAQWSENDSNSTRCAIKVN